MNKLSKILIANIIVNFILIVLAVARLLNRNVRIDLILILFITITMICNTYVLLCEINECTDDTSNNKISTQRGEQ